MTTLTLATLPKPEGAPPLVVSNDVYIKIAYPVSRDFAVAIEMIEPLGQHITDSIQAFFEPQWQYRVFEKDWLYAICESGISSGYQVTANHEYDLCRHPLAPMGLTPKNVFEVIDSSWATNSQVPPLVLTSQFFPHPFELKHYIFAFNDTVFECATTHFSTEYVFGSKDEVSAYVVT